ncbi:37610_t:CDS:2 [Gigaspora margarita]|uniref:37610_t:CDS:1 n=1 Tax=Gigaspora margarita TaxID=4874 RepID=A0ABN7UU35_GIGMA|nr:37610_t:CDS:2 [Gigaspora margarita]
MLMLAIITWSLACTSASASCLYIYKDVNNTDLTFKIKKIVLTGVNMTTLLFGVGLSWANPNDK